MKKLLKLAQKDLTPMFFSVTLAMLVGL